MTIYYKNGFFDDTDGGFVPESAVEIIQETYLELLNGQAQGKQIIVNKTGHPALIDPQPSTAHQLNLDTLTWEISAEKQTALLHNKKKTYSISYQTKPTSLKTAYWQAIHR